MSDYCKECPCYGCPFDVCGRGSELCSASVGDYCQKAENTLNGLKNTKKNWKRFKKCLTIPLLHDIIITEKQRR